MISYLNKAFIRTQEYAADAFAVKHGHGEQLISALITLFKKNKSKLIVDSMYSKLYLTHPTLVERIKAIKANKDYKESELKDVSKDAVWTAKFDLFFTLYENYIH